MSSSAAQSQLPVENVWDYPRPPALHPVPQRLRVVWKPHDSASEEVVIADSTEGFRVLETSHPPTYYIPSKDVNLDLLTPSSRSSYCEWKGTAAYYNFQAPGSTSSSLVANRIWTYKTPTPTFKPIAGYLSFYASSGKKEGGDWYCEVAGERVVAQDGDFYGGWKTSNIEGKMKGAPGTTGW